MNDLNEGLVVHLIMDAIEDDGFVPDASGRGNHGRLIDNPPSLDWEGIVGRFLVFSDFERQLTIKRTEELGIFAKGFTVAAWVKCEDVEESTRILF